MLMLRFFFRKDSFSASFLPLFFVIVPPTAVFLVVFSGFLADKMTIETPLRGKLYCDRTQRSYRVTPTCNLQSDWSEERFLPRIVFIFQPCSCNTFHEHICKQGSCR